MPSSPFLESLSRFMAVRRYSKRSIEAYLYWIRYYIRFNGRRHPSELGSADIERFWTYLAVDRMVSAATQRVALSGLAFLYNRF